MNNDVKTEFEDMKERVIYLLKNDERCRNSDKWLIIRIMQQYTNFYLPYKDIDKIPSFETPRRTRQHIQGNLGILWPTNPDVIKRRRLREIDVHNMAAEWKAEREGLV